MNGFRRGGLAAAGMAAVLRPSVKRATQIGQEITARDRLVENGWLEADVLSPAAVYDFGTDFERTPANGGKFFQALVESNGLPVRLTAGDQFFRLPVAEGLAPSTPSAPVRVWTSADTSVQTYGRDVPRGLGLRAFAPVARYDDSSHKFTFVGYAFAENLRLRSVDESKSPQVMPVTPPPQVVDVTTQTGPGGRILRRGTGTTGFVLAQPATQPPAPVPSGSGTATAPPGQEAKPAAGQAAPSKLDHYATPRNIGIAALVVTTLGLFVALSNGKSTTTVSSSTQRGRR